MRCSATRRATARSRSRRGATLPEGGSFLQASKIFSAIETHLLCDEAPSAFLRGLAKLPEFREEPFSMLGRLGSTPQPPEHHPEGNVWNHTLLVVDEAAKRRDLSSDPRALMWAALLHDIGKPAATRIRNGKITAYGHDTVGSEMARRFLSYFTDDIEFIGRVAYLVRYHMQILYVEKNLPFKDLEGLRRGGDCREVALLCLCDRLGRAGVGREAEEEQVRHFLRTCLGGGCE